MKRKTIFTILSILGAVFILIISLIGFVIYHFFFDINSVPKGEYLCESVSPNGNYTVKIYITNEALSVGGTRGEVINNKTEKKRNIYWEYNRNLYEEGIIENSILWESDEVVVINGKRLNVKKDAYDWRKK